MQWTQQPRLWHQSQIPRSSDSSVTGRWHPEHRAERGGHLVGFVSSANECPEHVHAVVADADRQRITVGVEQRPATGNDWNLSDVRPKRQTMIMTQLIRVLRVPSISSQRLNGLHLRRTACRNPACRQRHRQQKQSRAPQCRRIVWSDAEEHRLGEPAEEE